MAHPASATPSNKVKVQIELYTQSKRTLWDDFVRQSKNGTFLFLRDYMEYHHDRFEDHSLLVFDENQCVALLPANRRESSLVSHGGLTYGGFITTEAMKLPRMLAIFDVTFDYLRSNGVSRLIYKTIPFCYHRIPAEEDRYALFLGQARLTRRAVLTVCDNRLRPAFQERRKRGAKKARQNGLMVRKTNDFAGYWSILEKRLQETHGAKPVHTLAEIELLHGRFPEAIKLYAAMEGDCMIAGIVIHETDRVARAQYIAASERGQELGALDLLFTELLTDIYAAKPYFDFGSSDEDNGARVNKGLIDQKEGYGARVIAHDHYELETKNWRPGLFTQALV